MYDAKAVGRRADDLDPARNPDALEDRATARHRADRAAPGPAIRVMHCEDSESYQRLVAEMLMVHPDIEVVGSASDGRQALADAEACAPDLILFDAQMSYGGPHLVAELRALIPGVRIVMLSGLDADNPSTQDADGFISNSVSASAARAGRHAMWELGRAGPFRAGDGAEVAYALTLPVP